MKYKGSILSDGQQAFLASLAEYASDNGIDLTSVTRENYRNTVKQLEEIQEKAVAGDLHDYLTGRTDDYSDRIADYLEATELSPSKKHYHWNKMLGLLRSEFTTRPQNKEDKISRELLMEMALNVYQMSKRKSQENPQVPEPKIAERTEALLSQMSRVSRSDYQKRLQHHRGHNFPRDMFLQDIKVNTHNDEDLISLTDKIAAAHVQEMLGILGPAEQDKYIASLRKNDLAEYIPEGYGPHKKEHETKQNNGDNPHKEGDKTMADTDIQDTQNKRDESHEIKDIYQNLVYIYSDYLHDRSMSEEQMLSKMNQVFDKLSDEERQDLDRFIRNEIVPQAEERNGTPGFIDGGNPLSWCFKIRGYLTQYERIHDESMQENPHKQGDKTMTEENKNTEDTAQPVEQPTADTAQPVEQPTGDTAQPIEQPTEENFKPSAIQQKACEYAGIDWKKFKDNDSISAAIESAGLVISGANIIDLKMEDIVATVEPETEEQKKEAEEFKKNKEFAERDEGVDMADLPSKNETKELNVSAISEEPQQTNNGPTQDNEPVQDDWIARKAVYYKGLSDNNLIKDYARDETVQNGFAASFDNAQIRYSSPSTVSVSQAAGLNVFDAMLKEPDNKGRKVNFAEDMPPAMAARLYAACLINGNEMGGHVPQLTDEQLKEALGNEEYAAFQQKMAERANGQPETPTQETPTQETPTQEASNQEGQSKSEPTLDTLKDKNIEISRENNNSSQIDLVAKDENGQTTFEFHGELKDFYETKGAYSAKSGEDSFDNKGGDNKPLPEADRQFIAEKINGFMLKEALMDQYKMAQMESHGKIIKGKTGDSENAANVTLKGRDCTDEEYKEYKAMEARASHGKSFLAKEFEKDPARVREAAGNIIREIASGKTTDMSVTDVREAQIKAVREKMAQNKTDSGNSDALMDHDKKILALSGRLPAGEKAYVTKGGEKQEVKALEGDAKTRFEARNKDSIDRALKNYQSRSNG